MKFYLDDLEEIEINKVYFKDSNDFIKNIPDKSIDCIYTDVPYLYELGGAGKSELGQRLDNMKVQLGGYRDKQKKSVNDFEKEGNRIKGNIIKSAQDYANLTSGFDYKILDEFVRVMKKVNIIIWFSKLQMQYILNYFMGLDKVIYFEPIIWGKSNPPPMTNNTWLSDMEYAFHFREQGVSLNDGYDLKKRFYQSPINKKDKDLYDHPTIKPLEFVKQHILHITQENDIVLDPFFGSGTTGEACLMTNRNFIGIENDPHYFKIAQDRLNGITQQDIKEKDNGILNIFDFMEGETE